jgi:hypothetical protein
MIGYAQTAHLMHQITTTTEMTNKTIAVNTAHKFRFYSSTCDELADRYISSDWAKQWSGNFELLRSIGPWIC